MLVLATLTASAGSAQPAHGSALPLAALSQLRLAKPLQAEGAPLAQAGGDGDAATATPDSVQLTKASLLSQLASLTLVRKDLIGRRDKRLLSEADFQAQMTKVEIESGRLHGALWALRGGTRPPNTAGSAQNPGGLVAANLNRRSSPRRMRIVVGAGLLVAVAVAAAALLHQFVFRPRSQERSDRLPSALEKARR
jgi:hypothetical protein